MKRENMTKAQYIKHERLKQIVGDYNEIQSWLEKHRKRLKILKKDHELLNNDPPYKINYAVDFHEIYRLVYPLGNEKELKKIKKSEKGDWIHQKIVSQTGRICLFYGHVLPPILLPPYRDELQDFLFWLTTEFKKAVQQYHHLISEKKKSIQKALQEEGADESYEKFSKFIENNFFQLSILVMGGYIEGFSILKSLFSENRIELVSDRWHEYSEFIKNGIEEVPDTWFGIIEKHRKENQGDIEYNESDIKRENSRDLLALNLVKALNKKFKEENKKEIVLLVSDAVIFNSLLNSTIDDDIRNKTISGVIQTTTGEQITLCRTTDIFHTYLLIKKEREELKGQYKKKFSSNPKIQSNRVILKNIEDDLRKIKLLEEFDRDINQVMEFCNKNERDCLNLENCPMKDFCLQVEKIITDFQKDRESLESLAPAEEFDIYSKIYKNYQQAFWFDEGIKQIMNLLHKDEKVCEEINEKLQKILEDNPLRIPPREIVRKGISAIGSYFNQMEEHGPDRLYEARLLLVGEPYAGKTTLLKKILDPNYKVPCDEEEPTLGIEINSQWKFDYKYDKSIIFKVNIWDFGGQPIQYMLHQYFLTSRSFYILVSDDREQRTRFDYWFDIIKILGEKSPVLVVLNEKKHQSISNFDYDKYKKRYSLYYEMEKRDVDFSKNDGRFEALKNKIEEMLSGLQHIGDELPWQWVTIRKELESIKEESQISISRYIEICKEKGLKKEQDMLILCGYLNALGVIMYYKGDGSLEDTIFLNPNWIVDALYTVISDKTIKLKKGRLNKNFLFSLWQAKGYNYGECCKLLNLMLKDNFEICFKLSGAKDENEEYIVPMLLPDVAPYYNISFETDTLKFRFQYSFMPEGLISRLIVRLHEDIENQAGQDLIWKRGFFLNRNGTKARVAEDLSEKGLKVIDIKISGDAGYRRDLLLMIRNEVRKIHKKSFEDIDVEEMVPCICTDCRTAKNPNYFEYSVLQLFLRTGKKCIPCFKSTKDVDIWKLIEEVGPMEEFKECYQMKKLGKDIDLEQTTVQQIKDLEDRIKITREQLETEENKKAECNKMAARKANRSSWWIFLFDVMLVAVWGGLVLVFGWSKMEEWATHVGLVGVVVNALYFAIFRRKLNSEEIKTKRFENEKDRLYHLYGVNLNTINRLEKELNEAESQKKNFLSSSR
ncbi:MAG: ADP-ribosylation factor-like protein [Candidatus Aminicenantes bacterium]|nr:ADP-ribosylation factor-like protein [Candidatus Aminicenantes bacterium]